MPQPATARRPNGRPRRSRTVDWDKAEAFFLSLDPPRKFTTVGAQFAVSAPRVGTVARQRGWLEKAAEIDREAAAGARRRIVRSRTDRVAHALKIVDSYLDQVGTALEAETLELRMSDMPGLVKLAELLEGEATDRVSVADVQSIVAAVFQIAGRFVPADRRAEFMAELDGAVGGLIAIEGGKAAA